MPSACATFESVDCSRDITRSDTVAGTAASNSLPREPLLATCRIRPSASVVTVAASARSYQASGAAGSVGSTGRRRRRGLAEGVVSVPLASVRLLPFASMATSEAARVCPPRSTVAGLSACCCVSEKRCGDQRQRDAARCAGGVDDGGGGRVVRITEGRALSVETVSSRWRSRPTRPLRHHKRRAGR